ncbi:hypothetical protein PVK06_018217 [Gossypium arboreum]|uniref:Tryptophan synthase beta chain-like PALP domain-containing protein n=1 Tax=Gossypium arboreum TaxID=29729 RepID=A0ABR0Q4S8_GOSAR|nr:hypothetical protein PVK06_018217 [Gossypium arboreum]
MVKGQIYNFRGRILTILVPTRSIMPLLRHYSLNIWARTGLLLKLGLVSMELQQLLCVQGTATLKDATSEAIQDWVTNVETTHYILGLIAGPHPYLMMVRESHAVVGKETRKQALEKWGGKPDVLVARNGGGSNAMGLFHEFVNDKDIRLIGVEAAGFGPDSGKHAANFVVVIQLELSRCST